MEREREREMMIACEVRGRKRRGREGGRESDFALTMVAGTRGSHAELRGDVVGA